MNEVNSVSMSVAVVIAQSISESSGCTKSSPGYGAFRRLEGVVSGTPGGVAATALKGRVLVVGVVPTAAAATASGLAPPALAPSSSPPAPAALPLAGLGLRGSVSGFGFGFGLDPALEELLDGVLGSSRSLEARDRGSDILRDRSEGGCACIDQS